MKHDYLLFNLFEFNIVFDHECLERILNGRKFVTVREKFAFVGA